MHKIWFGLAFAAIMANPAPAQDYNKNFAECVKELGLNPDVGYAQRVQSEGGPRLQAPPGCGAGRWRNECTVMFCLATQV